MTPTQHPRAGSSRGVVIVLSVGASLVLALVVAAAIFFANGGRWFLVSTPSMGEAAPVGTLVLTAPATTIAVGDIISFHPPTAPAETYTHRIVAIDDAGISTRGDINGATDPWTLSSSDLIGRAVVVLPVVGWIIKALPILILGALLLILATAPVRSRQRRAAFRVLGASVILAIAAFILRPFTGVTVLQATTEGSEAHATIVSTGILPIQVVADGGATTHLVSGQVGEIIVPIVEGAGYYHLTSSLGLDWWGWVLFFLVCFSPLIGILVFGLPADRERLGRAAHA